jgi:hypothetical protein
MNFWNDYAATGSAACTGNNPDGRPSKNDAGQRISSQARELRRAAGTNLSGWKGAV